MLPPKMIYFRIRANLSQTEVAARLEVTPSTVSRWEKGKNPPLRKYRRKLAALYNCTEEDLLKPME